MSQHARKAARDRALPDTSTRLTAGELRLFGVLFFVFFTGLVAQIQIPLPPDGVPQTLQSLVVILSALALGPRFGTLSMVLYLLVGALGAPMFSDGGYGPEVLFGRTGGYLLGFVVAQPVIGWLVRDRDGKVRGWGGMILAVVVGHLIIFAFGVPVLGMVMGYGPLRAMQGGLFPFLPAMVLKCGAAVVIGRIAAPWASRRVW